MNNSFLKRIFIKLAIIIIFITGCGIESFPYLEPPEKAPGDTTTLVFLNKNSEADYFKGFELYYKFYKTKNELDEFNEEFNNIDNPVLTDLTLKSYNRIYTFEKDTNDNFEIFENFKPFIYIETISDRTDSFYITLNFGLMSDDDTNLTYYPFAIPDPESINIANTDLYNNETNPKLYFGRNIDNNIKSFHQSDLLTSDSDIPETSSAEIYLSVYALSYGLEDDFTTDIYSEPVSIDSITLNID